MSGRRLVAAIAVLALAGCASAPEAPLERLSDGRYAMGTVLEITLHGRDAAALARARDRLFQLAERLDLLLSSYRETSDVSRLNAAAGGEPLVVHEDVGRVLAASLRFGVLTRGSFDVTVGPLVSLWTRAGQQDRLPSAAEIESARRRVGVGRVRVGDDGRVALERGATLDLGGVAKGFALDRMLPLLLEEGVESALLSFGQSSAWAVGVPPDAPGWRLLARAPEGGFAGVVTLHDQALSVSSSLSQWTEIEGRLYGHVIDPRSGQPLTRRRQALVVGKDGALAEALSKALLILGDVEGLRVVDGQPDCHGLLLDADGGRFATRDFDTQTSFESLRAPRT